MLREVIKPINDKTATEFVFENPYRRVRIDGEGLYVLVNGQRTPVKMEIENA